MSKIHQRNVAIISAGFVIIFLGGITHILNDYLFWYPLGIITVPFITAWINWVKLMTKQRSKPVSTSTSTGDTK